MVLLEALGLAATEVFSYNRENFTWDQEQRLKRDLSRIEMQIARFNLFREDVEDLVKLTVDKMDMYHLVGAMLMSFTTLWYTKGRITEAVVPPFFHGVYFLSVAAALSHLLLAVWLSMHASVSSHSFGVRLRTRFVRLPIPNMSQLASLAAKLSDFEKTGVQNVMRLPFGAHGAQLWANQDEARRRAALNGNSGDTSHQATSPTMARGSIDTSRGSGRPGRQPDVHDMDLLGEGQIGFENSDTVVQHSVEAPGRHVQLFRKFQAKWISYDAYARVAMSLGVNQILQALSYYLIGVLLLMRDSPVACAACVCIMQAVAMSLAQLDIAGLRSYQLVIVQVVGLLPVAITMVTIALAPRDEHGFLLVENEYKYVPIAFFVEAAWFETLIWVARPSDDEASLPRRFRTVLYLDIFGNAAFDPTDAENTDAQAAERNRSAVAERLVAKAEAELNTAHAAVRRWEAIPQEYLTSVQKGDVTHLRKDLVAWRRMLQLHIDTHRASARGTDTTLDTLVKFKGWNELSQAEKREDKFSSYLLGPLTGGRFYDLENKKVVDSDQGHNIITLLETADLNKRAEHAVFSCMERDSEGSVPSGSPADRITVVESNGYAPRQRPQPSQETTTTSGEDSETEQQERPAPRSLPRPKVDKLPWLTVCRLARANQISWLLVGLLQLLQIMGLYEVDFTQPAEVEIEEGEGRRLLKKTSRRLLTLSKQDDLPVLAFDEVRADWPFGLFFEPASLAVLPTLEATTHPAGPSLGVLVGSTSIKYWANHTETLDAGGSSLKLTPALPRQSYPARAVALCPAHHRGSSDLACLWAELRDDQTADASSRLQTLILRTVNKEDQGAPPPVVTLAVSASRPWVSIAGGVVPCADIQALLPPTFDEDEASTQEATDCLVMVGWDRMALPVAVIPLSANGLPDEKNTVTPYFDAPLPVPSSEPLLGSQTGRPGRPEKKKEKAVKSRLLERSQLSGGSLEVSALHLSASDMRLWAALSDGTVHAWDLATFRSLGRLRPSWGFSPASADFRCTALATDHQGGLLMAGRHAAGPMLLWSKRASTRVTRAAAKAMRKAKEKRVRALWSSLVASGPRAIA
eukprot:TRINITY_DN29100_c0_g1_i1.p1 TRINITY_DN29100_c0_g1~~TRINITY_DN29100_c0_g1_i1.p1  ORF type:complete len:1088 (-),score=153.58 TRINITY_DN29100_c0_g1_i1:179-3442(-)